MSKKKVSLLILILILFLAASLRLYRIRDYLTFLGDEGRDVLIVKRMIVDHKFTLLGPITSVGSIYMGPVYYYFMAPFLWLFQFDPVGPAVMVALFSLATIFIIYTLSTTYLLPGVGLTAAFFYAISPLPVIYGRASWNPNIVPFFAITAIFALLKIVIDKKYNWFFVLGLTLGIMFQLHYVTFMFIPVILSVLLLKKFKFSLKYYIYFILGSFITYSPFLLFEMRHQFVNFNQAFRFMLQQKTESPITLYSVFAVVENVTVRLFWRLITIDSAEVAKILIIGITVCLIYYFRKTKSGTKQREAVQVIVLWAVAGIFSFALYRGVIYDYYFGSLFPAPFILTALFLYFIWNLKKWGKPAAIFVFIVLTFYNIKHSPLLIPPSSLLKNTQDIARFVFEKTEKKPYNFALIAGKNSDHAYRYFLEVWGYPPVVIDNPGIDPYRTSVKEQLLVVCEEKECKPLGHPLWEIAGFGRAEITDSWIVSTAQVFRLVHYKENENN